MNYNLGQDMKPEAATQTFAITGYKRQIDVVNSRQRVEQTRTPKFAYFQGPQPQTQIQGLDGEVAFNVNAAGAATRVAGLGARDRHADLYHHPLTLLPRPSIQRRRSPTSHASAPCARPTSRPQPARSSP